MHEILYLLKKTWIDASVNIFPLMFFAEFNYWVWLQDSVIISMKMIAWVTTTAETSSFDLNGI